MLLISSLMIEENTEIFSLNLSMECCGFPEKKAETHIFQRSWYTVEFHSDTTHIVRIPATCTHILTAS